LGRGRRGRRRGCARAPLEAMLLEDEVRDLLEEIGVVLEVLTDLLTPLAEALLAEGEPRAALLDDARLGREIEDVAAPADPLAVEDVELTLAEGRRHLVLHDLHAGSVADHLRIAPATRRLLDLPDAR